MHSSAGLIDYRAIGDLVQRTLMPYQSLREKGSTVFFLRPFLPLESLLFLQKYNHQRAGRFGFEHSGLHRSWTDRGLSLGSRGLTYLPTAIFARFTSQRRSISRWWDWKIASFNLQGGGESFQVLVAKFSNRWLGSGSVEVVQALGAWSHLFPSGSILSRSPLSRQVRLNGLITDKSISVLNIHLYYTCC